MKNAPRDQIKIEFARRLSAMIAERGWNQTDLARAASRHLPADKELGRDNVSNYVRGKVIPSPTSLQALAKALGCKPKDLLPERATHLLHDGVSRWKVAKLLGDSPETVERVYGHHSPDYARETTASTDRMLGA